MHKKNRKKKKNQTYKFLKHYSKDIKQVVKNKYKLTEAL